MDARCQLFDLKTTYKFETVQGIDRYNMPLYNVQEQPGEQVIKPLPVYQGFFEPCYVNGIQTPFYTQRNTYYNQWPNYAQPNPQGAVGNGTAGPYYIPLPYFPALPGHIDMTGIIGYFNGGNTLQDPILLPSGTNVAFANLLKNVPTTSMDYAVSFQAQSANGQNISVVDSGVFLSDNTQGDLYGFLMEPGSAPFGNIALGNGSATDYSITSNIVNYTKGYAYVTFNETIPAGNPINVKCYYYAQGIPRSVFFYNNVITIRPSPYTQYTVELGAYLTPAAFLTQSNAIPFGYMSEYIARGAARKILSDTGDMEQFAFYEPLFKEQEMLVWKRSQRIFTSTRTPTIYSDAISQSPGSFNGQGV